MSHAEPAPPRVSASAARRAERRERTVRPAPPPWPAVIALALAAALLLLAPPDSDVAWAVNAFRSLSLVPRIVLLVAAAALGLVGRFRGRSALVWWGIAVPLAIVIAFPLRESIHFLGDTQVRLRAMAAFSGDLVPATLSDWVQRLHASPLDVAVNVFVPIFLQRVGLLLPDAISTLDLVLALVFFAGVWRLSGRLVSSESSRVPLALALALTGTLIAFAGYAESGGLLAAVAIGWWAAALAPLVRRRTAVWLCLAWLLVVLSHRLGLVLLPALLWRALGPPTAGDKPESRRLLLWLVLATTVFGVGALALGGGGTQLMRDAGEMWRTVRTGGFRIAPPSDIANTLWLVAPLAVLAVALAGRGALAAFVARPIVPLVALTAIPLLVGLAWVFPLGASGLGAHRDWDANILLGLALTVAAGQLLALAPPVRLRAVLPWTLVVLAISAGGWIAVNADPDASVHRALALANRTSLPDAQRSHAYLFLGQRAMDIGDAEAAGAFYDRAFELNPNPRRALLAAEAWTVAGDPLAARRSLAQARARELSPALVTAASSLEGAIARLEVAARADSAAADSARADSGR